MPAKRKAKRPSTASNSRCKPISFRLGSDLVTQIDSIAKRLATTRSNVVVLVLKEYVQERGEIEVKRIVKEAKDAKRVDLFA